MNLNTKSIFFNSYFFIICKIKNSFCFLENIKQFMHIWIEVKINFLFIKICIRILNSRNNFNNDKKIANKIDIICYYF